MRRSADEGFQCSWDVRVTGDGVDAGLGRAPPVGGDGPCPRPSKVLDLAGGNREAERCRWCEGLDEVAASRLLCGGAQVLIEAGKRAGERGCVTDDGPGLLVGEGLPGALPLGLSEGGASPDLEPECSGGCLLGLGVEDGRCDLAVWPRVLPQRPDEGSDGVLGESREVGRRRGCDRAGRPRPSEPSGVRGGPCGCSARPGHQARRATAPASRPGRLRLGSGGRARRRRSRRARAEFERM